MSDKRDILRELKSAENKMTLIVITWVALLIAIPIGYYLTRHPGELISKKANAPVSVRDAKNDFWIAPNVESISDLKQKEQIKYGKELIAHTAKYLGPNGSVMQISNGMNCQNCHLQAGTAVFANNYGSVASIYPKFRSRSGSVESIEKRVNDCLERSLNGQTLSTNSKEMLAIVAYVNFLGSNVKKGEKAAGSGFKDLEYLDRAADPLNGQAVYASICQSCHQVDGAGVLNATNTEFVFPPLWGKDSYNDGAGLYRISNFAKFVKYNMPQGVTHQNAQLSDEEAWDVAAYVNTQIRTHVSSPNDWPDISKKPVDHPFGPYSDNFSAQEHKLGPFKPIIEVQRKLREAGD